MFAPKLDITSTLLAKIVKIEHLIARLKQTALPPEILKHIKKQCLVALTHFSTQIEGNQLSISQVSEVIKKNTSYGLIRDEKEVKNYFALLELLPKLKKKYRNELNSKLIEECHAILLAGIIEKNSRGKFRKVQNAVYEANSRKLVYLPPEPQDVKNLVLDLCKWVHDSEEHPVILASVFHNQFVTIHPFVDGNGRSARLLSLYLLETKGYDWRQLVPLDRYYADNRALYYQMLHQKYSHNFYYGRNQTDFTAWTEYYVEGIKQMLSGTLNQVGLYQTKNILMNNRQDKILKYLAQNKTITTSQYAAKFNISTRMATRDLTQLVRWQNLATTGKARATRYFLK